MLEKGRISSVQLLFLFFILEESTVLLYAPALSAQLAGRDAWIASSIPPTLYALLIVGVVLALAGRFPSQVLTEYLPEVIGRVPGKLLAAIYTVFFIHIASLIVNESSSFVHIAFFPLTPLPVLDAVWAVVAVYGAYLGIECIARQNQLVWPVFFILLFLSLTIGARDLNIANLKPVLENGLLPVISGGMTRFGWRGYVFFLLMLFPYLNQKQEALKTTLLHLALGTFVTCYGMVLLIGAFGDRVVAHMVFPYVEYVSYISLANFVDRLEILVVIIWVAGALVKLAVFYHSAAIAAASTLGLKSYRATLLPIAVITVIISRVLYGSFDKLTAFFKIFPAYAIAMELAVPALILLIAVLRKKRAGPERGNVDAV